MREITFRGQKVDNGEWVYGFLCCANIIDEWTPHKWEDEEGNTGEYCTTERHKVIPETVGQYTGLVDKNGKKIFEGDIVKFSHPAFKESKIGFVDWEENEVGFVLRINDDYTYIAYLSEFYEIIGNIYDNKEILEDKE